MGSVVTLSSNTRVDKDHDGDEVCHLYDKDPDVALCGADISGHDFVEESELPPCKACFEIDELEGIWESE